MKHNFKELDQFFDAARNGSPVMDDDAIASLVAKADANVPTEVMKQSPTSRILSAFKHQGGLSMTGLGLTALTGLLVTGYYLNSDTDQTPAQQQAASIATAVPDIDPVVTTSNEPAVQSVSAPTHSKPHYALASLTILDKQDAARFQHSLPSDSLWARIKPETIKPIELSADEINKLGVNDGGDGKVYLINEFAKGSKMKVSFPMEGLSISLADRDDPSSSNAISSDISADAIVTPIMPTMVTDAKGKKLAFFFNLEANRKGLKVNSMSFHQREGDDPEAMSSSDVGMSISDNSIDMNNVNINDDGGLEISGDLPDPHLPHGMKVMVDTKVEIDSNMTHHDGPAAVMMMGGDSNMKMNFNFDFKFDTDSLVANAMAVAQSAKGLEQQAIQLHMNADSIQSIVMQSMKGMNFDSLRKSLKFLRKNIIKNMRVDTLTRLPGMDDFRHLEALKDLPQMHIQMNDDIKELYNSRDIEPMIRIQDQRINNLIPVKIRDIDPNVRYNQNGLIFWYARDDKFAEKAPASLLAKLDKQSDPQVNAGQQSKLAVAKASVIKEPMVYPNPSRGMTMFKYSLKEPRAVTIAIHDLLGKQVLKVTDLEPKTAGDFEREIDLSSLDAGVYLLIMATDAGEQITQRVVLEK